MNANHPRPRRIIQALVLLAAGFILGRMTDEPRLLRADIREGKRREAFLAGSERSESTLKEIAKTLTTIDERLARFEKSANTAPPRQQR